MAKIGILTFHNAYNYGAVLQAFALKSAIEQLGHTVEIVNFKGVKDYNRDLRLNRNDKPKWYRIRTRMGWYEFLLECKRNQADWNKRCAAFDDFIVNKLLEGDKEVSEKELAAVNVDYFVIGSDQVWSENLTNGVLNSYWGYIDGNAQVLTYAASRNTALFSEEMKAYIVRAIDNFKAVSVREETLAITMKEIVRDSGKAIATVVDPTLLLKRDFYRNYQISVDEIKTINKKFLLLYYIDHCHSDEIYKCAEKVAEKYGLCILDIAFPKRRVKSRKVKYYHISHLSPQEFLWCYDNADFVVTSSFHGTVFSIIYEKPFYSVYGEDDRKSVLLSMCGLEDRHIKSMKHIEEILINKDIDYSENKLELNIRESWKFLEDNLNN